MANPKLMVEIDGTAGGLFSIIGKVAEKLQSVQQLSTSSADAARRSMGALEQGARAAAQALKLAEDEVAAIQARLRASGGSGPDPAAAMARLQSAQAINASMQAQYHAAQQSMGQANVMSYLRQSNAIEGGTQALHAHGQAVAMVDQRTQSMGGSLFQAGAALMALRAALQGLQQMLNSALDANLGLERAQRTLQMATGDGAQGMAFLKRTAQELGLELGTLADGYAMMAAASKGTTTEGKNTEMVFYSVARAASALSLSGDATHGVILALSQMMSKGKVMAEELRKQLGEHLPGAAAIAARAMGVTGEELNKMLVAGQVLSADFLPKFAKELDKTLGDAPEKAANSLQGNLNRIKTAFQLLSYEVGQGGAGNDLSNSLREIAQAMNSPEGILAAHEMSRGLGSVLVAAKNVAMVLWDLRAPIAALGAAWVGVKLAQIAKGIFDWGSAKVLLVQQTVAVRQAMIQEALASAGATFATDQNALAQVRNAQASVAASAAKLESAYAAGNLSVAEFNATRAAMAHTEAKLAEAAAIAATSATAKAASFAMGGVFGIVTLAVGALAAAYTLLGNKADEAKQKQELALRAIQKAGESLKVAKDLRDEYKEISEALDQGAVKADQMTYANDRLKAIQNKLILLYPEMKAIFEDENRKRSERIILLGQEIDGKEKLQRLDRAALEVRLKEAEARSAAAQAETAKVRALPANERTGYDEAGNRIIDITEDMVAAAELPGKVATAEAQSLREQIAAIDDIFKTVNGTQGIGKAQASADSDHLLSNAEIQARLAAIRASSEEKITLEQQKQHALSEVEKQYLEERAKLLKEAGSEEGKWFGKQAELQEVWAANETRRTVRSEQIEREYAHKREIMASDLQDKLTASEEGGLQKRLEAVRKQFVQIREENRKLAIEGKPQVAEEAIQIAEAAARARARTDQIKQDLSKLKTELAELAQIKGGPLSTGEMSEALARFASKSSEARAAVEKLKAELHFGESMGQGFAAGIRVFMTNLENLYERGKALAARLTSGAESSVSGFFASMIKHGQTASQKWDALWQGLAGTVVKALADMAAQELIHWGVQRAKEAWETARSVKKKVETGVETASETAKTTAAVTGAGAATAARVAETVATTALTVAAIELATAETWAAYAWIPFGGQALALAQIGVMMGSIATVAATFLGSKVVGAAEGAWFDKATLTVMGEGNQRELAVPEVSFMTWANTLAKNILAQERQNQAYSQLASSYARSSQGSLAVRGGQGGGDIHYYTHVQGHIIGDSERSRRLLGEVTTDGQRAFGQERSVVLSHGQVMGGL